jgi:hypothetical protein
MAVTGKSGIGTSAFLANWVQTGQNNGEKILYHLINNSGFEGDYRYISGSLINKITRFTGLPLAGDLSLLNVDAPIGADAVTVNLQSLLWAAAKNKKLILVLDGMDKIDDTDNAKLLN